MPSLRRDIRPPEPPPMLQAQIPEALTNLAAPWNNFYGHSKVAATIVVFLHVAPIVVGGGLAIALDRASLRLKHDEPGARDRHLAELGATHRIVLGALTLSILSGLALLASDLETFLPSWVFWVKMALIVALLVNGLRMTRLEQALRASSADSAAAWHRLRGIAITSLSLWLIITLFGVALTNVG